MKKLMLILMFTIFSINYAFTQNITKFGVVDIDDFNIKSELIDTSTNVLILFDIGSVEFETNDHFWVNPVYKRHTRIKILNKNGYEAAIFKYISYDKSGILNEIKNFKGSTFNLENNKVIETKLEKRNIIEKKVTSGVIENIYTFPLVREGSIIDLSYKVVKSGTEMLDSWYFENKYPCLYSQYTANIPTLLNYDIDTIGNLKLDYWENYHNGSFNLRDQYWNGKINEYSWSVNNINAIKAEPFVSNVNNYISRLGFRSSMIHLGGLHLATQSNLYKFDRISISVNTSKYFAGQINDENSWIDSSLHEIIKSRDTIRDIFEFVRNNFSNINNNGLLLSFNTTLSEIYTNRKGNTTDINTLLIAMLKKAHINVVPAILSTKDNGLEHPSNPILSDYNYLIAFVFKDSTSFLLDASNHNIAYKKLPLNCYNGYVRVLTSKPFGIFLTADSLIEKTKMFVYISNEENGVLSANCKETLGYYHSLKYREELIDKPKEKHVYEIQNKFKDSIKIKDLSIDSIKLFDSPISLHYFIDYNFNDDIVYFNPMMNQIIMENPFKSAKRRFPVEMPYANQLNYSFSMEVPKGYIVDELPKSVNVLLNEDEGQFEYRITLADNLIQLKCNLKFIKANYLSEDYTTIRDFYGIVVKKMNEEIVFKKIK